MRAFSAWPRSAVAGTRLRATTRRKSLTRATSSSALTFPSTSCRRDHSVIALGVGSPDMTPSENTPSRASGAARPWPSASGARIAAAAAVPAAATNWRRVCKGAPLLNGACWRAHPTRESGRGCEPSAVRLQGDVAVLAPRPRLALGEQRLERRDHLRAGLVRDDHVVDV